MNRDPQALTRLEWKATIPIGGSVPFPANCDYFYIYEAYRTTDSGAIEFDFALNGQNAARAKRGHMNQGVPGDRSVQSWKVTNISGVEMFIRIIYGNGQSNFSPDVDFSAANLSLSQATIDAINPPAETGELLYKSYTNTTKTFSGHSGITIVNTGTDPITITTSRGSDSLPVGESFNASANGRHDFVGSITVDATASASAGFKVIQMGGGVA